METINPKVFGHNACNDCHGAGKVPIAKIPFTDLFVWTECGSCYGTGEKNGGFERNGPSFSSYSPVMSICREKKMSFHHEPTFEYQYHCPRCK